MGPLFEQADIFLFLAWKNEPGVVAVAYGAFL